MAALTRAFTHVEKFGEGQLPYKQFQRAMQTMELEDLPEHKEMIDQLVARFKENWSHGLGAESFVEDTFLRQSLRNCIFVGHTNTDLDSIAGAIGAAELFRGRPARAEVKLNGEIECALKYIGMPAPPTFDSIPGGSTPDADGKLSKVCLVDHNEVDQMTPALKKDNKRMKRIVGLIDHHAVAGSFTTSSPLFMDVRPWGSMSSIVFHTYLRCRVPIRKEIAQLLLCAILSDTLNLKSGTTTPADRFCVALLSSFGEVEDIDDLAMQLFTAKTQWIVGMGAYEMIRGDQKNFVVNAVNMSLAVLEVTAMEPVLKVAEDLLVQIRVFKYEKGDIIDDETGDKTHDESKEVHVALLFIVDTINQKSVALISGNREKWLAEKAFPDGTFRAAGEGVRSPSEFITAEETLRDLGGLVSRKLEFLPKCTEALQDNELPEWMTINSTEMKRLGQVLDSGLVEPLVQGPNGTKWDTDLIKGAVYNDRNTLKRVETFTQKQQEEAEALKS